MISVRVTLAGMVHHRSHEPDEPADEDTTSAAAAAPAFGTLPNTPITPIKEKNISRNLMSIVRISVGGLQKSFPTSKLASSRGLSSFFHNVFDFTGT